MQPTLVTLLVAVAPFALIMSFTPGPNNLMLANAGAQFGFVRTLPHQAGVVFGYALMTLVVGLGVAALIKRFPLLYDLMKIASVIYLLYLAFKIATTEGVKPGAAPRKPMTFLAAAGFQWINPKGWIMALGALTTYTSAKLNMGLQVVGIDFVFFLAGIASTSTWALFGEVIRRYLTTKRKRTIFNYGMAALLLVSVAPALIDWS